MVLLYVGSFSYIQKIRHGNVLVSLVRDSQSIMRGIIFSGNRAAPLAVLDVLSLFCEYLMHCESQLKGSDLSK